MHIVCFPNHTLQSAWKYIWRSLFAWDRKNQATFLHSVLPTRQKYPFINSSIHSSICPPIYPHTYPSTHLLSTHLSIHPSMVCLSIPPFIHLPTHTYTYPCVHLSHQFLSSGNIAHIFQSSVIVEMQANQSRWQNFFIRLEEQNCNPQIYNDHRPASFPLFLF